MGIKKKMQDDKNAAGSYQPKNPNIIWVSSDCEISSLGNSGKQPKKSN